MLSPSLLKPVAEEAILASNQQASSSLLISTLFSSPWSAGAMELARANKMDSFWPWVITIVSAPVMAGKQIINVVQLVRASQWLAEGDIARRKEQALSKKK